MFVTRNSQFGNYSKILINHPNVVKKMGDCSPHLPFCRCMSDMGLCPSFTTIQKISCLTQDMHLTGAISVVSCNNSNIIKSTIFNWTYTGFDVPGGQCKKHHIQSRTTTVGDTYDWHEMKIWNLSGIPTASWLRKLEIPTIDFSKATVNKWLYFLI